MVQAIQVLRFHLLELEKVSIYFSQLKTFNELRSSCIKFENSKLVWSIYIFYIHWYFIHMHLWHDINHRFAHPTFSLTPRIKSVVWNVTNLKSMIHMDSLSKLNCIYPVIQSSARWYMSLNFKCEFGQWLVFANIFPVFPAIRFETQTKYNL